MSKLLQSVSSSGLRYSRNLDASVTRGIRRRDYGRLGADGGYESATPSFSFRIPRKLRILRLGSRRGSSTSSQGINTNKLQHDKSGQPVEESSRTLLGRLRDAYERVMIKAASKSGELTAIPIAKASRAPPALASSVSSWTLTPAFGSRQGTKISDLDPGFKMTAVEKKYLEHLKRTASVGRV